jgi:hypothetical protein
MSIFDVEGHMCICTDKSVTIVDSNDIPDNDISRFLDILRNKIDKNPKLKDRYKRSVKSWEEEWIFCNKLYKIELFKAYSKDITLKENESVINLLLYEIFGKEKKNTN